VEIFIVDSFEDTGPMSLLEHKYVQVENEKQLRIIAIITITNESGHHLKEYFKENISEKLLVKRIGEIFF
jgi:hypothetical protein